MRTAEDLRRDSLLDPQIAHLNHGAFGAAPRSVLERQRQLRDELELDPVEFLGRRLPDALAGVRAAGNGHKWLCAPKGSAFLYVRDELQEELRPPVVSWGWNGYQGRFGWGATDDPTAVLALPAAIDYQAGNDWPAVRKRCHRLARLTQATIVERLASERIAPEELQAPWMVAFEVPPDDAAAVQRGLRDRHHIEVPVHEVDGRTLVRLSVQGYTTEEDCERLVDALTT